MRLTDRTDYAIRVLMYLAVRDCDLATFREIAERYGISRNRLTKVVWEFGRAGFVETVRGKGGGLRLSRSAETISVGAVARHTERSIPMAECFPSGAGACRIAPCCQYRIVLAEAQEAFFAILDRYTVHDLVHRNRELSAFFLADPP